MVLKSLGFPVCLCPDSRLLLVSLAALLLLGLCITLMIACVLPGSDCHLGKSGKLDCPCVHEGDDIGSDVRGGCGKEVLLCNDRHLGLVTLPGLDLGHHVLLHNFSGCCLFNDKLALQKDKALAQLLFALLFGAFLQLFLVGCKAPLQYVLCARWALASFAAFESVRTFCTSMQTSCGS